MKLATAWLLVASVLTAGSAAPLDSGQKVLGEALISPDDIVAALKHASVIPDILPHHFHPHLGISLTYPEAHETVFFGNVLDPDNTTSKPILQISKLTPTATFTNKTYTLVLTDPDATSHAHPTKAQMCHWIATGIDPAKGNDQELELRSLDPADDAMDASDLIKYMPPSPPKKTGLHRYVFVLLEPEALKYSDRKLKKPKDRPRWGYKKKGKGVMKWAKKNHLVPVAANYFLAQHKKQ